jgi:hypothetical protein
MTMMSPDSDVPPSFAAATVTTDSEIIIAVGFLGNHTYSCALTVCGGVCNCQSGHNPSVDPWPLLRHQLSKRRNSSTSTSDHRGLP